MVADGKYLSNFIQPCLVPYQMVAMLNEEIYNQEFNSL